MTGTFKLLNSSFFFYVFLYQAASASLISLSFSNKYYIILSTKNNNLNAGISSRLHKRETGCEGGREALSLSTVESIVLLTLWFIILSCLGRCSKRPSHNILLNRSIVHAIRMHVSEVPFSGVVSAHMCAAPECRQCSLCASTEQKMLYNKTNKYPVDRCICTPVYKFNMD